MVKIKICGLTNLEDAGKAIEYGADLLGFVFIKGSPRLVDDNRVRGIIQNLPGQHEGKVGLFRDAPAGEIADVVAYCGLDHVQLQGSEPPSQCRELRETLAREHSLSVKIIKAFKVREKILSHGPHGLDDYDAAADYFVFDTFHPQMPGGTGIRFDLDVLIKVSGSVKKPFFVAGGLDPSNVADVVRAVRPYGVDISSGVEGTPGKKDEKLLKEFIQNAKKS